jgi:hypothetical protein
VHKRIGAAIIGLDKTVALGGVEPFYCSGGQRGNLVS